MPSRAAFRGPSLHGARAAMDPLDFGIGYRLADDADAEVQTLRHDLSALRDVKTRVEDRVVADDGAVAVCLAFDGEQLEVYVEAHAAVLLEPFEISLRHAFATDEAVLVNGVAAVRGGAPTYSRSGMVLRK